MVRVAELKKEQQDDDNKKEYCDEQFDLADDKKKVEEKKIADLETAITESEKGIVTTKEQIVCTGGRHMHTAAILLLLLRQLTLTPKSLKRAMASLR